MPEALEGLLPGLMFLSLVVGLFSGAPVAIMLTGSLSSSMYPQPIGPSGRARGCDPKSMVRKTQGAVCVSPFGARWPGSPVNVLRKTSVPTLPHPRVPR